MREPTKAMLYAVDYDLKAEWLMSTMIDAALAEGA